MGDSPKTLSDVKVLLEEAVKVVSDLEAAAAPADSTPVDQPSDTPAPNEVPAVDAPTEDLNDQAVAADKAQLASDEAQDQSSDAGQAESDNPSPPTA